MSNETPSFSVRWLATELERRQQDNPRQSLRGYAKQLEIPSGRLSEILSGKRGLSQKLAVKLAGRLGLSPEQKSAFLSPGNSLQGSSEEAHHSLSEDAFTAISCWQHFALLSLMNTYDFRSDLKWISRRLGLTTVETRATIERLIRLGLIQKGAKGYCRTHQKLKTTNEISSPALKKSHRQSLEQAIGHIEATPLDERDITSMTMAIDPKKIPLAKSLIRDFRYRLAEVLESGRRKEVYNLNVQLVPVTRRKK
ncbi:MAG: TIGR02147 family protein [Bacteriovoracia bacterium]